MTNTSPRDFFENHVRPPYEQWKAGPPVEWIAKSAISEQNIMAERMFEYWKPIDPSRIYCANTAGDYREMLATNQCSDFGLVRDVAELHKHFSIGRPSRRVSRPDQTKRVTVRGDSLGSASLGSFRLGGDEVVINLNDGTKRSALEVAENVLAMWDRLLTEMGL